MQREVSGRWTARWTVTGQDGSQGEQVSDRDLACGSESGSVGDHGGVTRLRNLGWKKLVGLVVGGFVLLVVLLVGVVYARTTIPPPSRSGTNQATTVLYADGPEMGRIGKNRILVSIDRVSDPAQKAVLAAEDRQFYSESGISLKGIGRAIFANVKGGGVSQGGSTITQQYAKNAFLTQQRTFTRKIKEAFIAVKLSQTVSHSTILEDYLNVIYFGRGAYGIEAAAQTYFGVPAAKLTAAQGAVLASSIRSPSGYDPERHAQAARDRWNYVLDGMVKQKWLDPAERSTLTYPKVRAIKDSKQAGDFPGALSYVKDQVLAELAGHGFDEDRIAQGGLIVRTTLLRSAENPAIAAVNALVPPDPAKDSPVSALVSVKPGTGEVIAYVGGRTPGGLDFADDSRDKVKGEPRRGVTPGSSMKPYVLAAALQKGMSLGTQYDGSNHQDICGQKDVTNDAGDPPFGQIDLSTALAYSVNTVYLRLACDVGPKNVVAAARAAGVRDVNTLNGDNGSPSAQIALGSGGYEVHPLDQAVGYATFAAKGQRAKPYFVKSVLQVDGGSAIYTAKQDVTMGFSEAVAADVTSAMQQVVETGTGVNAQLAGGRPAAGKTGTTTNNTNAWFIGFTPQLSTAVWLGRPSGAPLKGVLGSTSGVYGGTVPAKIFKQYMDAALQGAPIVPFPPKANVGTVSTPTSTAAPYTPPPTVAPPTAAPTTTPSPTPAVTMAPPPTSAPPPPPPATLPPPPTVTPPPATSAAPAPPSPGSSP